jgi:endonuclease G
MRHIVFLLSISLLVAPDDATAHGGGLNAEGGHYNRKTGDYHCHREPCFSNQQQQVKQRTPVAAPVDVGVLSTNNTCNGLLPFGAPDKGDHKLCRTAYAVGVDCSKRGAAWVAYTVSRDISDSANVERSNDFRPDLELPEECRKELYDFNGSYDRGHLVSAETLDGSYKMNSETFLLSNMSPQLSGFNRAIWRGLENRERKWANQRGQLHVITGPIHDGSGRMMGRVPVPTHYYKILFDPASGKALSFIIPHQSLKTASLGRFISSIDEIEAITGIDFLSSLEDPVEAEIERSVSAMW